MELIIKAQELRALLSEPECWTQQAWARNKYNEVCDVISKEATKWCLAAGCVKVCGHTALQIELHGALVEVNNGKGLFYYNDTATHEQILALIDKLIAKLENVDGTKD